MIKFLHAADWHLDAPFAALSPQCAAQRRQEQRTLLQEIAELANAEDAQLLLLSGDLFDRDGATPETLEAMRRAFAACPGQIVIAPGNHDYLAPGSPYLTEPWPENVHIFKTSALTSFEFPQLGCRVWGAAFTTAHMPALLAGFRAPEDGVLNLACLHGDALSAGSEYNPISREQIAASNLSYLALGHIHAQSGLLQAGRTFYGWPGCMMGRGFDELGEKGVYLGTADDEGCTLRFVPLSGRRYELLTVPAGDEPLASVLAALPAKTENDSYRIVLTGESEPVDVRALYRALEPKFFSLQLRDETIPKRELWAGSGEDTLRGLFLADLKQQYDAATDEDTRRTLALAARLGLAAMDGREAVEP